MIPSENRAPYGEDHAMFREAVRRFIEREIAPHLERWEAEGIMDREMWRKAGQAGLLAPQVPEAYGGPGLDFTYAAVVSEEIWYAGMVSGFTLHTDVVVDYFVEYASEELKQRYLPGAVSGDTIFAIGMTEPGAGSDLQGIRTTARLDGDHYIINGSKTYITNGQLADAVVVVARTNPDPAGKGLSLFVVDRDTPGFERGRNLDKIGQHGSDTSELFFNDVRVPVTNRIGEENRGMSYLMRQLPQERLSITVSAQAAAQRAFDEAVAFVKDRKAFGKTVWDFQNTQFLLADLKTKLQVGWAHLDWSLARHAQGELDQYEASAGKLWHTEMQWEVMDACLQLHGGAGYMNEYPIARLWRDARVQRIYGGTSEIMKLLIARSI
jgi:long-chain-acyl-CoA dehydrogenase